LACCNKQPKLFEAKLKREIDRGTLQVTSKPGPPEVASDEDVGDVADGSVAMNGVTAVATASGTTAPRECAG